MICALADKSDIILGQRGIAVTLRSHVVHVVSVGSKEQMIWPDARGIVAMVADEQACGDRAVQCLPHITMGINGVLVRVVGSVSSGNLPAKPFPAAIVDADLAEESGFKSRGIIGGHGNQPSCVTGPVSNHAGLSNDINGDA